MSRRFITEMITVQTLQRDYQSRAEPKISTECEMSPLFKPSAQFIFCDTTSGLRNNFTGILLCKIAHLVFLNTRNYVMVIGV